MGQIQINISVDWEGHYLNSLHEFVELRNKYFRDIPITHFICPNYFLNKKKSSLFNEIVLPHDEIALHLHSWKPLIQAAGITFKTDYNYYNSYVNTFPTFLRKILVSGRGVPITVYNYDELHKFISFSKQLLEDTFNIPISGFRAGGWIINKHVFEVLENLNFTYDSSAVPPSILSQNFSAISQGNMLDNYGDSNGIFTQQVIDVWGNQIHSEGYLENAYRNKFYKGAIDIYTQAFNIGGIIELPNNGGMSDFASPEKTCIPQLTSAAQNKANAYISIGCHQEGDIEHKMPLIENILYIKENITDYEFITNEQYIKKELPLGSSSFQVNNLGASPRGIKL